MILETDVKEIKEMSKPRASGDDPRIIATRCNLLK